MLLDEAVIGMFGGGVAFSGCSFALLWGGGPRQAVSVIFLGVMVPSLRDFAREGSKKKLSVRFQTPPPIYYYGICSK